MQNKYFYSTDGASGSILLNDEEALINDECIKYEHKLSESSIMLRVNNVNYEVRLIEETESGMRILVNGEEVLIKLQSIREQLMEKAGSGESSKKRNKKITSPMPGIITKVCKKTGDKIEKGDVIIVLEAMKMENELKAEHSSVIKKINIIEKQSVDKGQLLIELDEG